jgi:hypothetical protein
MPVVALQPYSCRKFLPWHLLPAALACPTFSLSDISFSLFIHQDEVP